MVDTYHFADSTTLKDIAVSVPAKGSFDALLLLIFSTIPYSTLPDKDTIVALPLILPKLKVVRVVEG